MLASIIWYGSCAIAITVAVGMLFGGLIASIVTLVGSYYAIIWMACETVLILALACVIAWAKAEVKKWKP